MPNPDPTPRDRIIAILESIPGCEAVEKGPHVQFVVNGKGFGYYMEDHHGNGRLEFNCKAPPGVQAMLIEQDPDRYYYPDYVGHRGWIGAWLDVPNIDWELLESAILEGFKMTAPKKLLKSLETPNV